MSYKFKNYLSVYELSTEEIIKINRLIESVKANYLQNKRKSWYRHIFDNPISFYEIKKLFHIAEQLEFVETKCYYDREKNKNNWTCRYLQSLPGECLDKIKIYSPLPISKSKKNLKIDLVKNEIQLNPTIHLKQIAKNLNICYASIKQYYKIIKQNDANLIQFRKENQQDKLTIVKKNLAISKKENEEMAKELSFYKQMYHQYMWFQKESGVTYDPGNNNWIKEIKNLIYIGRNHKTFVEELITQRDHYKSLCSKKLPLPTSYEDTNDENLTHAQAMGYMFEKYYYHDGS